MVDITFLFPINHCTYPSRQEVFKSVLTQKQSCCSDAHFSLVAFPALLAICLERAHSVYSLAPAKDSSTPQYGAS
jgi:hypothetical protein